MEEYSLVDRNGEYNDELLSFFLPSRPMSGDKIRFYNSKRKFTLATVLCLSFGVFHDQGTYSKQDGSGVRMYVILDVDKEEL